MVCTHNQAPEFISYLMRPSSPRPSTILASSTNRTACRHQSNFPSAPPISPEQLPQCLETHRAAIFQWKFSTRNVRNAQGSSTSTGRKKRLYQRTRNSASRRARRSAGVCRCSFGTGVGVQATLPLENSVETRLAAAHSPAIRSRQRARDALYAQFGSLGNGKMRVTWKKQRTDCGMHARGRASQLPCLIIRHV